eukprot:12847254-Alexandrium_andersonii.AAC.1
MTLPPPPPEGKAGRGSTAQRASDPPRKGARQASAGRRGRKASHPGGPQPRRRGGPRSCAQSARPRLSGSNRGL